MKLILNIILGVSLVISGLALWKSQRILKNGNEDETLTEQEADALTRWLNILRVCSIIEVIVMILRIFLPLF